MSFLGRVVQPDAAEHYDWSRYDRVVQAATRHQLKVVGVVDYTAPWARLPSCAEHFQCQPRNPQLFANYAGAAAAHFAASAVPALEIWNEPNISQFWLPAPNAAYYTAILTASYRSIKAVDPGMTVILGRLSPSASVYGGAYRPLDFMERSYGYGAHGSFDALSYHPNTYPNLRRHSTSRRRSVRRSDPRGLRSIMSANGDPTVPIRLTEVGAPTGGPGPSTACDARSFSSTRTVVSECLQAKLLADPLCQTSRMAGLGPTFIYSYQDRGTGPATVENFFGLLRADGG